MKEKQRLAQVNAQNAIWKGRIPTCLACLIEAGTIKSRNQFALVHTCKKNTKKK